MGGSSPAASPHSRPGHKLLNNQGWWCMPALWRWKQGHRMFKVSLSYIRSWGSVWTTWHPSSKRKINK